MKISLLLKTSLKGFANERKYQTLIANPYREGEICILIPKDNPELRGKSGCWGAVTHVGEYSYTIETWEAEYIVKIEDLLSLELSDDNCKFMRELLGRMRRQGRRVITVNNKYIL
ncbi:hypothetical protein NIES4071_65870 [Calothrix sp. NIES-4071]|nr:hypothetical protein NIES4071_65870 [Calothrix sp. NIES-4071]BAZ60891.1 hypothetical protein NIES4105_65830 [Calothrix sp. NIES-4105]